MKAINAHMWFIQVASSHGFSAGERLLWYAIAYALIDNKQPLDENGSVQIGTNELMRLTGLSKATLWRARNDLIARGLLKVEKRTYHIQTYALIGFTQKPDGFTQKPDGFTQKPDGFTQKPDGFTQKPDGFTQKPDGFTQKPPDVPQQSANAAIPTDCAQQGEGDAQNAKPVQEEEEKEEEEEDIYYNILLNNTDKKEDIYNNNIYNNNIYNIYNSEKDKESVLANRLCDFWKQRTGNQLAMSTAQRLVVQAKNSKMDFDVLLLLLERSESANSPMQYAFKLLLDWKQNNVHTRADAESYLNRRITQREQYHQRTYTPSDDALDAMMEEWRAVSEVASNDKRSE